jgi:hypothetical protein
MRAETNLARRIKRYLEAGPKTKLDIVRHIDADSQDIECLLDFMVEHNLLKSKRTLFSKVLRYELK